MIGYDISWCAFHIVEVMSIPWFGYKRIGYLSASLTFNKNTDVILLTTHLFRKVKTIIYIFRFFFYFFFYVFFYLYLYFFYSFL
jgi:hypothetical protein